MTTEDNKARVLFVDDEPNLLAGVVRNLRSSPFRLKTAADPRTALELIAAEPFDVIVSDLRMPGMDGVALLKRTREMAPDTVRVLLTGQADLEDAIAAINQGAIFRFITKPCPSVVLLKVLEAAVEQHRLLVAERELLEHTLHGSVRALTDILSLVSPEAFGRATRLHESVSSLLASFEMHDRWQVEVAAMLSQVGCVILPPATVEKLYDGRELTEEEQAMVERMPAVVEHVLGNIPRLEPVLQILAHQRKNYDGSGPPVSENVAGEDIPWGSRALRIAGDLDLFETQLGSASLAFDTMRGRVGCYDPAMLERLAQLRNSAQAHEMREVPLRLLCPGMVLAQDVRTKRGSLIVARGQEVTPSLLERLHNFAPGLGVQEPIRVIIRNVTSP